MISGSSTSGLLQVNLFSTMRYRTGFVIMMLFQACARPMAPSGGPPDKVPPVIVSVIPQSNSTSVPVDQIVQFEFSEGMNKKSLSKALFITPDPGQRLKVKWKGRRLRLHLGRTLDEDRTYIVTLGTDLKDAHGNAMAESYTLAFSTGQKISSGSIQGRVYEAKKKSGILMWAYILRDGIQPNPMKDDADYVTQTDQNGGYEFSHLSKGGYRLFAVEDSDGNRFFELGSDGLGVTQSDVTLPNDSAKVADVSFRVTTADTLGPALNSIEALDQRHMKLQFDEALEPSLVRLRDKYHISSSAGEVLVVEAAFQEAADSSVVLLRTAAQHAGTDYAVKVQNLTDLSGNIVDENFNRFVVTASAAPDTFKPKIIKVTPADSARNVPLNSDVRLFFSEDIARDSFENGFQLIDTSGIALSGSFGWLSPVAVSFMPERAMAGTMMYHISVDLDSVIDAAGNFIADSIFTQQFITINADTLSSIAGMVTDQDSSAWGRIYLEAGLRDGKGPVYHLMLEQPGPYLFKNILPGEYVITAFRDTDDNGKYSYGSPAPFRPSERFVFYEEGIKVRARWPNEGNNFSLPVTGIPKEQ